MAEQALSPDFLRKLRDFNVQRQALGQLPMSSDQMQALSEASLNAQGEQQSKDRAYNEGVRQFNVNQQNQADATKKADRAATVSGITNSASTAANTYIAGKALGAWGSSTAAPTTAGTAATAMTTPASSGVPAFTSTGTPAADYGFGAASTSSTSGSAAGGADAATSTAGSTAGTVGTYAFYAYAGYLLNRFMERNIEPITDKHLGGATEGHLFTGAVPAALIGNWVGGEKGKKVANIMDPAGWVIKRSTDNIHKVTGTVICTELCRQGLLPAYIRKWDAEYGAKIDRPAYIGYLNLAWTIVEKMKRSKRFTKLIAFFAIPTAREMAHRMQPDIPGTVTGKIILAFGLPICRWQYRRKLEWLEQEVA